MQDCLFFAADKDYSGTIDFKELEQLFQRLGLEYDQETVDIVLADK